MRHNLWYVFAMAGLIGLSGCAESPSPVVPVAHQIAMQDAAAVSQQGRFRLGEEESINLAAELSGFGGFYIDDTGDMHVYLKNPGQAGIARAALARTFSERQRNYTETERHLRAGGGRIVVHRSDLPSSRSCLPGSG